MTRSAIELLPTAEDRHLAKMAAFAIGLAMLEAGVPSPLPGVKPGLANIVVLLVLERYGLRAAAWVSILRVVGGSLMLGSFLTPGFFLSFCGAVASLAALAAARALPRSWFGPVSHSLLAAFAHLAGQLTLAWLWLIPHPGILYLVPPLASAALVFGLVNGLVAARFLQPPAVAVAAP
ncbi:MAG TPA: Gx transporter family protein [Burkholderiales bacterium]